MKTLGMKLNKSQLLGLGTLLALATFLGSGMIEALLYYVKVEGLSEGQDIQFTSTLFFLAGINGLIFFLIKSIKSRPVIKSRSIIGGVFLGVPNFFSIGNFDHLVFEFFQYLHLKINYKNFGFGLLYTLLI